MENFKIDITSFGDMTAAMTAAFAHARTATHFAIRQATPEMGPGVPARALRLVFYRSDVDAADVRPLPVEADGPAAAELARLWLLKAEYGQEPTHDGGTPKGWRIYNGTLDHSSDWWAAICAVSPVWARLYK